jgi:hypothetical protein
MRMLRGVAAAAGDAERARSMDGNILRISVVIVDGRQIRLA